MAVKQYKTPMGSKTVVGRALLGVMHSNCDGNRMFQAEVLFRTKKVKQECCVSFYVAGQNTCLMRACILSQDKRSDAPRDGYSAWLTIKLPGGMQVLEAKRALQAAKEWHGLLEQQRLGQICFASVNIACGKLLGHLVNDTNIFHPPRRLFDGGCDCMDYKKMDLDNGLWCKHVAAICYVLVNLCEKEADQVMTKMGINVREFLKEKVAGDSGQVVPVDEQAGVSAACASLGTAEDPIEL